jgi:hypothetical protein
MELSDPTIIDRFWDKIDKTDTCWNWSALINEKGYGYIKYGGKHGTSLRVHRLSALLHHLVTPDGKEFSLQSKWLVLHKCGNRRCVNPSHLYIGNQKQNVEDAIRDGTHNCIRTGSRHNRSKLSAQQREEIVALRKSGAILSKIAERYSISQSSVSRIYSNAQNQY